MKRTVQAYVLEGSCTWLLLCVINSSVERNINLIVKLVSSCESYKLLRERCMQLLRRHQPSFISLREYLARWTRSRLPSFIHHKKRLNGMSGQACMTVERGIVYGVYGVVLGPDVGPGGARASMGAAAGTCVMGAAEAGGRGLRKAGAVDRRALTTGDAGTAAAAAVEGFVAFLEIVGSPTFISTSCLMAMLPDSAILRGKVVDVLLYASWAMKWASASTRAEPTRHLASGSATRESKLDTGKKHATKKKAMCTKGFAYQDVRMVAKSSAADAIDSRAT